MKKTFLSPRVIAFSASLAALSAVLQLIHLGYQSPQWGMWIDVVAVSWLIAFFLFGVKSALAVSAVGALVITLFAPDTWLGASMKWIATIPIITCLYLWLRIRHKKLNYYSHFRSLVIPTFIGLILRILIVLPLNYFYAIPIWTGMTPEKAFAVIPWYIIGGFNTIQGILDVVLAWLVVYRFRLSRFAENT